ncbi:MAG: Ribosomal RNA large subunit methyltransferase H [Alphaproteobacteria bacterium ADurb.Bin438]|nr:MAG: Ribosomal RNA large subunit methyltransferase H [Alphaproteobacteria bacterium ADurb.Bin438]
MARLNIISVGKFKNSPLKVVFDDYKKQLKSSLDLIELDVKTSLSEDKEVRKIKEGEAILEKISKDTFIVILDERGKEFKSIHFASEIEKILNNNSSITFVIGGADGLCDKIKDMANLKISFGIMTWPHMMVRVMLIEQIFRAFSILNNHPYHRE